MISITVSVSLISFVCMCVFKINFYWSIVSVQCCVSLCCTTKWISSWYTYIPCFGFLSHLLLLLLLSRFSRVRLGATPWTAAYQASPFLGFSRQEHWSGLPFPSPMHESGKWKWSHSVVPDSSRPHGLQPTRLLHPWDFLGNSTGVGCHCLLP